MNDSLRKIWVCECRRLWLAASHRKHYNPSLESAVRVCGIHFINGECIYLLAYLYNTELWRNAVHNIGLGIDL